MRRQHYLERFTSKADVCNWLGWQLDFRSYLEIATPHTGFRFGWISDEVFSEIDRALYDAPGNFSDGLKTSTRSSSLDSRECLQPLLDAGRAFDIIFLDAHHTYEASRRDLELALRLLAPHGILVAHDCYPLETDLEYAGAEYRDGDWMGVTYLAFLDTAKAHPEFVHNVIHVDHGIGLLYRRGSLGHRAAAEAADSPRQALLATDYHRWDTFHAHAPAVLNLISTTEFVDRYRTRPPSFGARTRRAVAPIVRAVRDVLHV